MSDVNTNRYAAIVVTIQLAWMAWLSLTVIGLKSDMSSLQLLQSNVIPPVVEGSFKELREKGNSDKEILSRLTEIAGRNAQDIGYIKEQLVGIREQLGKKL